MLFQNYDKKELSELENTIEYKFKDRKYLKIALTHKSYLDEQKNIYQIKDMSF